MNLESNLETILDNVKTKLESIRRKQYMEFNDPYFGDYATEKDITTEFTLLDQIISQLRQINEGASALGISLPQKTLADIKQLETKAYGFGYFGAYHLLESKSGNSEYYAQKLREYQSLMR